MNKRSIIALLVSIAMVTLLFLIVFLIFVYNQFFTYGLVEPNYDTEDIFFPLAGIISGISFLFNLKTLQFHKFNPNDIQIIDDGLINREYQSVKKIPIVLWIVNVIYGIGAMGFSLFLFGDIPANNQNYVPYLICLFFFTSGFFALRNGWLMKKNVSDRTTKEGDNES